MTCSCLIIFSDMLRLTHSKRLFSTTIRNKNFFEINPLYPKTGEH